MSDLRQLSYFVTLAEWLNYGKAANVLNISQPPLSRQIAALEDKLGAKLFHRHHYGVSLTAIGQTFYTDAKAILSAYDLACRNVCKMSCGEKGLLSVGFMMHAAYSTIPELTKAVISAYPDLQLTLHEATPAILVDAVLEGKYDVGLVFNPGPVDFLNRLTIGYDKLCLAVNQTHRLASAQKIRPVDLRHEPLIATPHSVAPVLREMIDLLLRQHGVEPYYRLETQLQQTIVSLVAEGIGVALVPESVKKLHYPGVNYVELDNSPIIEQVIIWRCDNSNPVLTSFTQLAIKIAEKK